MKRRSSIHNCPTSPWARRKSFLSNSMINDEEHMVYQNPDRFFCNRYSDDNENALEDDDGDGDDDEEYIHDCNRYNYGSLQFGRSSNSRILSFSIPLSESQGFSWNQDLYATQYQQKKANRYNSIRINVKEMDYHSSKNPLDNFDNDYYNEEDYDGFESGADEYGGAHDNYDFRRSHSANDSGNKRYAKSKIESMVDSPIRKVKNNKLDSLIGKKYKIVHKIQSRYITRKGSSKKSKVEVSEIIFLDDDVKNNKHDVTANSNEVQEQTRNTNNKSSRTKHHNRHHSFNSSSKGKKYLVNNS